MILLEFLSMGCLREFVFVFWTAMLGYFEDNTQLK